MTEDGKIVIKECEHEFDHNKEIKMSKYGMTGKCVHCGLKIYRYKLATLKKGKVHMSKKERLKQRKLDRECLEKEKTL